jgi:hypothetical protein
MKIPKLIMALFAIIWSVCIALVFGYTFYSDTQKVKRIANSFKKESNREKDKIIESGRYIPRPDVEQRILDLFQVEDSYLLIYGEHAVGKSTTVKYAVKKAREHKIPVLYIQAEGEKEQFHQEFIQALEGFTYLLPSFISSGIGGWFAKLMGISIDQPTKISDIIRDLKKAATILQEETGKRPVLIIDACNKLAEQEGQVPTTLNQLQELAKVEADLKRLLIVFVSSEGSAPKTLFSRSDSSRMIPYRMGELSRTEADQYLERNKGFKDSSIRSKILDITGYTFEYLMLSSANIEMLQAAVYEKIDGYLKAMNIEDWKTNEKIIKVVKEILENGYISYIEFINIFGKEYGNKVLEGNVFSRESNSNDPIITFQNVATRNYFARKMIDVYSTRRRWLW